MWRVGRSLGRTLYLQEGAEPSKTDRLLGLMESTTLATEVVRAMNQADGQAGGPQYWSPKNLGEHLRVQAVHAPDVITRDAINRLIGLLDLHRPLGSDGKHGDLHTPTCGCVDV